MMAVVGLDSGSFQGSDNILPASEIFFNSGACAG